MHLYVHVPFCARRCSYCDFAIAVRREVPSQRYVDAILTEWQRYRENSPVAEWTRLNTLYFGGGTPSRLDPTAMYRLIERLTADTPLEPGAEVTIEVNPDDVTIPTAMAWRAAGITRVSLGVQSHDPEVLAWMHRTHTADQVTAAVVMLREAGFDEISLDLIFALPEELHRDWERDLELTLALRPTHVSLYGLTVEPATPLARWQQRGEFPSATDGRYASEYLVAHRELRAAGYEHYEVSNAGLGASVARHNLAYWSGVDYLGIGPGAHSLLGGSRHWHLRDWAAWERAVLSGATTIAGSEVLTSEAQALEEVYLGLRTRDGIPASRLPDAQVASWIRAGWAKEAGKHPGWISLTAEGWLRLDALVAGAVWS